MAIFRSAPHPSEDPNSSLRLPATKRISASQRLSTILEGSRAMPPPTVPLRSILRPTYRTNTAPMAEHPAFRSQETLQSGPPAYGHIPGSSIADSEDLTAPVEGEACAIETSRRWPKKQRRMEEAADHLSGDTDCCWSCCRSRCWSDGRTELQWLE